MGLRWIFGSWLFLFCALLSGQTFTNVTSSDFPGSGPGNVKASWGDYNNDGWRDLFSFNGRRLFRNDWDSVEETGFTEIALPQHEFPPSQNARGASWGDHDNDGDLDLYQGGYAKDSGGYFPDTIIKNNGDDNFTVTWTQPNDTVVTAGRPRPARGVTSADFDRDGDIDVYVSNYR